MQILINDPDAAGGSTAINLAADEWTLGQYNAAVLERWAAAINANFAEVYLRLAAAAAFSWNYIPFSTVVPMDNVYHMPPQAVAGPMAFTAGAINTSDDLNGCWLRLTADGNAAHIPTYGGTSMTGDGWVNTAGVVNEIVFAAGAVSRVWQGSPQFPEDIPALAPSVASITISHGLNPTVTIEIGGSGLNPAVVPSNAVFSVTGSDGAQMPASETELAQVSVTNSSVSFSLQGTVAVSDTLTLSYTPPAVDALVDTSGNRLGAITAATVTAS